MHGSNTVVRLYIELIGAFLLALVLPALSAQAQTAPGAPAPSQPAPARDAFGRDTPQGTARGFLHAARRGDFERARRYLDTTLDSDAAATLANQLFVVLDVRLPVRLPVLSNVPEGSRSNPLIPDHEVVGTISSAKGPVDVVLERVDREATGRIWLVSSRTLVFIPGLYEEVVAAQAGALVPKFLTSTRLGGVPLLDWLVVLLGLPAAYSLTVVLNRMLTLLIGFVRRLFGKPGLTQDVLPRPARLLVLALVIQWVVPSLPLSLVPRQFWSMTASVMMIAAVVWLLLLVNGVVERYIKGRFLHAHIDAADSLLRLGRRAVDVLILFAGLIAAFRLFGINTTPALAGLGVGGIAVAFAAQKTLENVIAGGSLILDRAVDIGDSVMLGSIEGTVDHVGLRSTRIRAPDRTIVRIPNSQIANATVQTLSARDKYWFHPMVGLRFETTSEQLRAVVERMRGLLSDHPSVERHSMRVRFFRVGAFSLDVEVSAYVFARDWAHYLEIQEQLLFGLTELIEKAGTRIALPSQTLHVDTPPVPQLPEGASRF